MSFMPVGSPSPASPGALRARQEFAEECVELFAEVVQLLGVPRSVGQIYGLLYASPEPLSFSDIVEQLDISKGSVSQGLQFLRSLGAIRVAAGRGQAPGKLMGDYQVRTAEDEGPEPVKGRPESAPASVTELPRREYYEPELSLRKLMSGVLQERITPLASTSIDRISRLRKLAGQARGAGYLDRVKQLETWRKRLRTVLPMLGVLLAPKSSK